VATPILLLIRQSYRRVCRRPSPHQVRRTCGELSMTTIPRVTSEGFAHRGLPRPSSDIGNLSERLGMAWGVSGGECIPQYLAWSEQAGLFSALSKHGPLAVPELQRFTCLNESGLDALLGILASVGVVMRCQGAYGLTT